MASMLSLLDVLPRHERVDVGGVLIDTFGISGEDIGRILERFPNAFQQISDSSGQPTRMDPGLLGALLAASQRNEKLESLLGDEATERHARAFGVGDQLNLLQAMGRCTFPDGVGPFLESLVSTSSQTREAIEVVVQAATRERPTASQPTPRPSAQPDTPASGS